MKSYHGKVLHVNLSLKETHIEDVPKEVYSKLVGGKGLGIYLLLKTKPKVDPLSPSNDFIFITGPLTGTLAPSSDKFGIVTKSPATGGFLDSYSSGLFGSYLKNTGFDAIVLHEKAEEPSIVIIENNSVRYVPARKLDLLGKSTKETHTILEKEYGSQFASAVIGPAGESQVLVSSVFFEMRCSGRGGAGAVLGSKNVKAVLVKGNKPICYQNPEDFKKSAWIARRYIRSGEITARAMYYEGTANIIEVVNYLHGFPTNNFQTGYFQKANEIDGNAWEKNYWRTKTKENRKSGNIACYTCPISCSKIAYSNENKSMEEDEFPELLPELNNEIVVDGPEYETIALLGSNVGNSNQECLLKSNYLCDYYGIDTISTGNIIGFLMELYEKKVITSAELDGIKPQWGDEQSILDLIRKIGKNEGCGKWISRGVKRIAEKLNNGKHYAMHVKGLEFPGYEPRASNGMALSYALSDRGACHLHGFTAPYELMGNFGGADPFDLSENKLELFLHTQEDSTLVDCAIICHFTLNGLRTKECLDMLRDATGFKHYLEPNYLDLLAKRVLSLTRFYNYREGFTKNHDALPPRITEESYEVNKTIISGIQNWDNVLSRYYSMMGWDEGGSVSISQLEKLGVWSLIKQ